LSQALLPETWIFSEKVSPAKAQRRKEISEKRRRALRLGAFAGEFSLRGSLKAELRTTGLETQAEFVGPQNKDCITENCLDKLLQKY
jgi:hypothetical protein